MFKSAKTHRLSHNIVKQIRNAILAGDLKPGDRLPSEKELAISFNVSKASLREAIRSLEALGLVEVLQGVSGGVFIREVDLETARNSLFNYIFFQNPAIHEFTQLRLLIEPQMAALAAIHSTDEDLAFFNENLEQTSRELDSGEFYYKLDSEFHHRIATISNNRLIIFVIDSLKNAIVNLKLQLELDSRFSISVFDSHQRIVDAFRKKDAETALEEMRNHIISVDKELVAYCDADSPFISVSDPVDDEKESSPEKDTAAVR
ncbi:FadR/GntR family transcriptional regulator [Desulfatitalea alkaliphila]|uniref:FadR family transcriptional regulator n=1 Tax=Desulfatitalea alkaliphila TaxID=2929485 RepID=A0AA41R2J4_9BACT|nr:FadR/GntR family transcriptional regulator [Desulfatitalea alkaliphila]MCJ8499601.1 FadR family transcriptional regulator [Desulfatitalea alkaliphila]